MREQITEKIFDLLKKYQKSDVEIEDESLLSNLEISEIDFATIISEIEDEYDLYLGFEGQYEFETVDDFCGKVVDFYEEARGL
jgi:acyl carrier protein